MAMDLNSILQHFPKNISWNRIPLNVHRKMWRKGHCIRYIWEYIWEPPCPTSLNWIFSTPGLFAAFVDPLEKGMATHSSILAWRIPWTEDTDWLWSMGSQRVEHDWEWLTFHFISLCFCDFKWLSKRETAWAALPRHFGHRTLVSQCFRGTFLRTDEIKSHQQVLSTSKIRSDLQVGKHPLQPGERLETGRPFGRKLSGSSRWERWESLKPSSVQWRWRENDSRDT